MQTTEHEFWLISELITMGDRETAMLAESLIWNADGSVNQGCLARMVEQIVNAPTQIAFHAEFPAFVRELGRELGRKPIAIPNEYTVPCRNPGITQHGFVKSYGTH